MSDDTMGKGPNDAMVGGTTALTKHPKPTLMKMGTRWITSDGRWHANLAADYVLGHGGLTRWIPLGELARVFFGSGTPSNKDRVRYRMHQMFTALLGKGLLLVVEYGERNAAQACKLYDATSKIERDYVHARLKRMAKMKTLKAEQFERAVELVEHADVELHA